MNSLFPYVRDLAHPDLQCAAEWRNYFIPGSQAV
jgi:hypothetical protein